MTVSTSTMTPVVVIAAQEWSQLREWVMDYLVDTWHPDFTCPQIFRIGGDDDNPAVRVAQWVARVSAQMGTRAPIIQPGGKSPLEADRCMHRIGVTELLLDSDPSQADQLYAMGLWTRLATRGRRFWMRVSPQLSVDIAINAGEANPVLTLQVAEWSGLKVVIVSQDLLAAEVAARAFRAIAEPAGDNGITPWQDPIVQAGIEQHLGAKSGRAMSLEVITSIPPDHADRRALDDVLRQIAETLDTTLSTRAG